MVMANQTAQISEVCCAVCSSSSGGLRIGDERLEGRRVVNGSVYVLVMGHLLWCASSAVSLIVKYTRKLAINRRQDANR